MMSRRGLWLVLIMMGIGTPVMITAQKAHSHDKTHAHDKQRPLAPEAAPASLALTASADSGGGYNLHLDISNFRFSPENVGKRTAAVEGHAHLYINGRKIGRIYGPWLHIPAAMLTAKVNRVVVTLNDNVHKIWTQKGVRIEASLRLNGSQKADIDQEFYLKPPGVGDAVAVVTGLKGQTIRVNITAAPGQAFHLHGYDLSSKTDADGKTSMIVTLQHTGRFPLVVHGKDDLLGQKETAFAYVEVRSK